MKLDFHIHQLEITAPIPKIVRAGLTTISNVQAVRDSYTKQHETQVARLASLIAKELGYDEMRQAVVYLAAEFHDIGKVAIPHDILAKPSKLSDAEMTLVRDHSLIGKKLMEGWDEYIPNFSTIIAQHHERIDGKGYPYGLTGDQMLQESKIVAVCDVFDAMTAHRPYRPAVGIVKALEELESGKGIRYDADITDIILSLHKDGQL